MHHAHARFRGAQVDAGAGDDQRWRLVLAEDAELVGRVALERALGDADDGGAAAQRVVDLAPLCDGEVMYYGLDPDLPVLAAQRGNGGRGVFVRDGNVVLAVGPEESALCALSEIPLASSDVWPDRLQNILGAVAAAWAAGLPADLIRSGLETFDEELAPASTAATKK